MTREKHTPGPWEFEFGHDMRGSVKYWQVHEGSHAVCNNQFCYAASDEDESIANARLIAAAPDLLEALKVAENLLMQTLNWKNGWECSENDLLGGIRAAIAKAEGRS